MFALKQNFVCPPLCGHFRAPDWMMEVCLEAVLRGKKIVVPETLPPGVVQREGATLCVVKQLAGDVWMSVEVNRSGYHRAEPPGCVRQ